MKTHYQSEPSQCFDFGYTLCGHLLSTDWVVKYKRIREVTCKKCLSLIKPPGPLGPGQGGGLT